MVFTSSYGASGELSRLASIRTRPCSSAFRIHTHVADQREHGGHVLQARHVLQHDRLIRQQGGAQFRQRRILGAGNPDFAVELPAPANQKLVHV